jgi:glycosyltransferase involved in cell wall biosynthesis
MINVAQQSMSVSVVIPVKTDAEALERCLLLLTQQTTPPLEIVVVDNGSTDDSARVASRLGARVIEQPMPGIPAAAAAGYDTARGDVIARCDADSRPPVDWIERIMAVMRATPSLDAVTGNGRFYDVPGWLARALRVAYLGTYYLLGHAALGHPALWGSNLALRRSAWYEVRHLVHRDDPEVHDDMDLAFALGPKRYLSYDRTLVVGVSARSLRGSRQLRRRFRRAFHTLHVNWRCDPPWERWRVRLNIGG